MSDEIRTHITTIRGVLVEFVCCTSFGNFFAEPEEGHVIEDESFSGICKKLEKYFSSKPKKKERVRIPVLLFTNKKHERKKDNSPKIEVCTVLGIHSSTGAPIIKEGSKPATQRKYDSDGRYLRPMSLEDQKKLLELSQSVVQAKEAFKDFENEFIIPNIVDYIKEQGVE